MAVGPIPERDVAAYAQRAGLDWWNERIFTMLVRRLDAAYLDDLRAAQKPPASGERVRK